MVTSSSAGGGLRGNVEPILFSIPKLKLFYKFIALFVLNTNTNIVSLPTVTPQIKLAQMQRQKTPHVPPLVKPAPSPYLNPTSLILLSDESTDLETTPPTEPSCPPVCSNPSRSAAILVPLTAYPLAVQVFSQAPVDHSGTSSCCPVHSPPGAWCTYLRTRFDRGKVRTAQACDGETLAAMSDDTQDERLPFPPARVPA